MGTLKTGNCHFIESNVKCYVGEWIKYVTPKAIIQLTREDTQELAGLSIKQQKSDEHHLKLQIIVTGYFWTVLIRKAMKPFSNVKEFFYKFGFTMQLKNLFTCKPRKYTDMNEKAENRTVYVTKFHYRLELYTTNQIWQLLIYKIEIFVYPVFLSSYIKWISFNPWIWIPYIL